MLVDVIELQLVTKYKIDLELLDEYVYNAESTKKIFVDEIGKSNVEKVGIIYMDSTNKVINYSNIAIGTINNVKVSIAEIFKVALLSNASKFIIAHNHPSGILEITKPDIDLTKNIGAVAKLFDMELVDSVIVNRYGELMSIRAHLKEINYNDR